MRLKRLAQGVAAAALVVGLAWGAFGRPGYTAPAPKAGFSVKIDFPDGHGSGTHIGHGFIVTAAHVVDGRIPMIVIDTGDKREADVLWINKDYDVALLRIDDYDDIAELPLSCAPLNVGARYVAYGNPGSVDFVSASGSVVGKAEKRGPWRSVVTVDGTVVMGMSGGAVVSKGQLVGVAVGVQSVSTGFLPVITGFGFVVPSSDVCMLLGRA